MKAKDKNSNRRVVVEQTGHGKEVNIVIEDGGMVGVGNVTLSYGQAVNLYLWLHKNLKIGK